jgi:hypothetical protein
MNLDIHIWTAISIVVLVGIIAFMDWVPTIDLQHMLIHPTVFTATLLSWRSFWLA